MDDIVQGGDRGRQGQKDRRNIFPCTLCLEKNFKTFVFYAFSILIYKLETQDKPSQ